MFLIELFLGFDPTVQVAIVGVLGGVIAAIGGLIKAWKWPSDRDHYVKKDPALSLSDKDRAIVEDLTKEINLLGDSVERLRAELQVRRR